MKHIPEELRGAVIGFVILLSKGLLEDNRWDWDIDKCDWQHYRDGFCDSTILRTTLSIFMNNLMINELDIIVNYEDARFRAFQYFRQQIDPTYRSLNIEPPFKFSEIEEPDWLIWEK